MSSRHPLYRMRKWYWDLLTPEHGYLFVYFATVELLGKSMGSFTVHHAPPGKSRPVTRSFNVRWEEKDDSPSPHRITLSGGTILVGSKESSIEFSQNGCTVSLAYRAIDSREYPPVVMGNGGRRTILWKPIGLKYIVHGSVNLGGDPVSFRGANGYIDYLDSTILPPCVPVHRLVWGRLHHPDVDLVYVYATNGSGRKVWSQLTRKSRGGPVVSGGLRLAAEGDAPVSDPDLSCPGTYCLSGEGTSVGVRVNVRRIRPVQESSFVDHQDISSSLLRSILRVLTRNPRSVKFLSEADVTLTTGTSGLAITGIPVVDEEAFL